MFIHCSTITGLWTSSSIHNVFIHCNTLLFTICYIMRKIDVQIPQFLSLPELANLTHPSSHHPRPRLPRYGRLYHIREPTRGFEGAGPPKAKAWVDGATWSEQWGHGALFTPKMYEECMKIHGVFTKNMEVHQQNYGNVGIQTTNEELAQ